MGNQTRISMNGNFGKKSARRASMAKSQISVITNLNLFDTALLQYKSSSPMLQKNPQKLYKVMDLFFSHNIFKFSQKLHY